MADISPGKPIDKLGLVCLRNRQVLFARTKGRTLFYIPGGKREPGETDIDALTREIREELGVDVTRSGLQPARIFDTFAHNKPPGTKLKITCYFGELGGEPTPKSEIEELAWLSYADCDRVSIPAGRLIMDWLKQERLID